MISVDLLVGVARPFTNRVPYITFVRVKANWLYLGVLVLQEKVGDRSHYNRIAS
ncbi:hypothetical protein [Nostoc sp. FACHB-888]|uniref:hypothetical protein n=1 Tax=Nostoc sp. FACHB-888 TaxID=2692842 RepID=UPI0019A1D311|nr:hypothetical protein [Nostoc sp. FACHB-888]MBD2247058.1 hypothetical protein [Nostoc sp. FACHB-888]